MDYPILYENKPIGTAQAERRGLYWHITCSCRLPDREIHRIRMDSETKTTDLGICVPQGSEFCLRKTVTIKQAGEGAFTFTLTGNREEPPKLSKEETVVILEEAKPVECLSQLENARLETRDEKPCLVITERSEVPQDSDPIQEPENRWEQP